MSKSKRKLYLLYLFTCIVITLFGLLLIVEDSNFRYKLKNKKYFYENSKNNFTGDGCPCQNIEGSSNCKISIERGVNNSKLGYLLKPSINQISDGYGICIPAYHIRTNSHGFRDYEYSKNKPKNTKRILVLGNSIVFGHGVELNETYSKVLERKLNNRSSDKKYQVLNFGVPDYNIAQKVELFEERGLYFDPDLIILHYLGDDIVKWDEFEELQNESIVNYIEKNNISRSELSKKSRRKIHLETYSKYLNDLRNKPEENKEFISKHMKRLNNLKKNDTEVLVIAKKLPHIYYVTSSEG